MIRLFKNFTKKDICIVLLCVVIMVFQVWIDLRLPEYMSEITKLIETNTSDIGPIVKPGLLMLLCAFLSTMYNTIPITIKAIPITQAFVKISSQYLSKTYPIIPPGIVAITRYQNILPSNESSFLTTFL